MDIDLAVETRDSAGNWDLIERPTSLGKESDGDWELRRNYQCFSMMTGKPLGAWLIDPILTTGPERGLPEDLSVAAWRVLESARGAPSGDRSWLDETVASSWLDLTDLDRFDWDAPTTWNYNALPRAEPPKSLMQCEMKSSLTSNNMSYLRTGGPLEAVHHPECGCLHP